MLPYTTYTIEGTKAPNIISDIPSPFMSPAQLAEIPLALLGNPVIVIPTFKDIELTLIFEAKFLAPNIIVGDAELSD